jgi:hypothetical protein
MLSLCDNECAHINETVSKQVTPCSRAVFLNRRAVARYRALALIIPDRES